MDSIEQLLHLRQGGQSIEAYVHQFGELSYQVPLYDEILFKDLFHFGLNEPIKSLHKSFFPGGEFKGSLSVFMDYALNLSDSLLLWVPRRRIRTPLYSLGRGRPHQSTLTRWRRQQRTTGSQSLTTCLLNQNLLTSGLPSQGLLASCRPRLSPRPRWPPRLRIRLFGRD